MFHLTRCLPVGPPNLLGRIVAVFLQNFGLDWASCVARLSHQYLTLAIVEGPVWVGRSQPTGINERHIHRFSAVVIW